MRPSVKDALLMLEHFAFDGEADYRTCKAGGFLMFQMHWAPCPAGIGDSGPTMVCDEWDLDEKGEYCHFLYHVTKAGDVVREDITCPADFLGD